MRLFKLIFDLFLERDHVSFYLPDSITKLQYHLYRTVSKYNLLTRHPNYYIKKNYIFFSPSIRMSRKSINFEDKKSTKVISTKAKNYLIYMT